MNQKCPHRRHRKHGFSGPLRSRWGAAGSQVGGHADLTAAPPAPRAPLWLQPAAQSCPSEVLLRERRGARALSAVGALSAVRGAVRGPADGGRLGSGRHCRCPGRDGQPAPGNPCVLSAAELGRLGLGTGHPDGLSAPAPTTAVPSACHCLTSSPGEGTWPITCVAEGQGNSQGLAWDNKDTAHCRRPARGPLSLPSCGLGPRVWDVSTGFRRREARPRPPRCVGRTGRSVPGATLNAGCGAWRVAAGRAGGPGKALWLRGPGS